MCSHSIARWLIKTLYIVSKWLHNWLEKSHHLEASINDFKSLLQFVLNITFLKRVIYLVVVFLFFLHNESILCLFSMTFQFWEQYHILVSFNMYSDHCICLWMLCWKGSWGKYYVFHGIFFLLFFLVEPF